MRDLAIVLIVFGSLPLILVRPQVGILMWFWLGMMNPHQLAWGYAQQLRVALVVGTATLIAWALSREPKLPPKMPAVFALAGYTFWFSLAALMAIHPEHSLPKWQEAIKILLMTFVTMCIVQERERLHQLVWVIVGSLGVYGVKGGIFSILHGGNYRIYGPPNSFIEENNSLALALIMILPLALYLRATTSNRWIKQGLVGGIGLTLLAILGSFSRGALVGLTVTLGYFWLKSRHKLITAIAALVLVGGALAWLPQTWFDRMSTIESYDRDESAIGRFDAWTFAFKLALDYPLTGGGQLITDDSSLFKHYVPSAARARAAHSIYFETLGETGFVGLGFFLLLLFVSFRTARAIIRSTSQRPDLAWAHNLASMIQVSLLGYAATGAFLSLGLFDLYYAVVAITVSLQVVVKRELEKPVARAVLQEDVHEPADTLLPSGKVPGYHAALTSASGGPSS
jgi:probable O-glycosylation ligase (exosortase A-associated)